MRLCRIKTVCVRPRLKKCSNKTGCFFTLQGTIVKFCVFYVNNLKYAFFGCKTFKYNMQGKNIKTNKMRPETKDKFMSACNTTTHRNLL